MIPNIGKNDAGNQMLTWGENTDDDFCYYWIYKTKKKGEEFIPTIYNQVGSTIANLIKVGKITENDLSQFHVIAVDQSGNTSAY